MQIFLSIDPFLDKPKLSAMPDWDARRRFGVFFVGVSGLLWPVLRMTERQEIMVRDLCGVKFEFSCSSPNCDLPLMNG